VEIEDLGDVLGIHQGSFPSFFFLLFFFLFFSFFLFFFFFF